MLLPLLFRLVRELLVLVGLKERVSNPGTPRVRPLPRLAQLWLGSAMIGLLIGHLTVSFEAQEIADEFGIAKWLVVIVNHATNFGAWAACYLAARSGRLPGRWTLAALLVGAGGAMIAPALIYGVFLPTAIVALALYGGVGAYAIQSVHTRVLDSVPVSQRGEAMGLIIATCLIGGVALVALPGLAPWRVSLGVIAAVYLALGVTFLFWKRAPQREAAPRLGASRFRALSEQTRGLTYGVAAKFSGWVAIYTLPVLSGVSPAAVAWMAVVGQLVAAELLPWAGRRMDLRPRALGVESGVLLLIALLGVALTPAVPVLSAPLLGVPVGWWLCGAFFCLGEYAGNVGQGVMEAALSRAGADGVREQLFGLSLRFLAVGVSNMVLAVLEAIVAHRGSALAVGVVLGVVSAVAVYLWMVRPMKKLLPEKLPSAA